MTTYTIADLGEMGATNTSNLGNYIDIPYRGVLATGTEIEIPVIDHGKDYGALIASDLDEIEGKYIMQWVDNILNDDKNNMTLNEFYVFNGIDPGNISPLHQKVTSSPDAPKPDICYDCGNNAVEIIRNRPLIWGCDDPGAKQSNDLSQSEFYGALRKILCKKDDELYDLYLDCVCNEYYGAGVHINVSGRSDDDIPPIAMTMYNNLYWLGFLMNPKNYERIERNNIAPIITDSSDDYSLAFKSEIRIKNKKLAELRLPMSDRLDIAVNIEYLVAGLVMYTLQDSQELSAGEHMVSNGIGDKCYSEINRNRIFVECPEDTGSPKEVLKENVYFPKIYGGLVYVSEKPLAEVIRANLDMLHNRGYIGDDIYALFIDRLDELSQRETMDIDHENNDIISTMDKMPENYGLCTNPTDFPLMINQ